jgi:hypothetical protein
MAGSLYFTSVGMAGFFKIECVGRLFKKKISKEKEIMRVGALVLLMKIKIFCSGLTRVHEF